MQSWEMCQNEVLLLYMKMGIEKVLQAPEVPNLHILKSTKDI